MKPTSIQQNTIITILLQTIGRASTTIAETKENELLKVLKDILSNASISILETGSLYSDLTPKQAENEIKMLDNMYNSLSNIFDMFFSTLEPTQKDFIKPEYDNLIDSMEELREGLELHTDLEFIEIMDNIAKGNLSDFVRVA